jgi:hypothetical protein
MKRNRCAAIVARPASHFVRFRLIADMGRGISARRREIFPTRSEPTLWHGQYVPRDWWYGLR